ncbi:Uncharacterized protein LW93_4749 [Fusarium fujikuroi]|nr:Uncharacterized protein LW93_4749 [Fusarium fujikuroi]
MTAVGTAQAAAERHDKEYSFIEALALGPRESFSLVSKEALGLPSSPSSPVLPVAPSIAQVTAVTRPRTPPQKKQIVPVSSQVHVASPIKSPTAPSPSQKKAPSVATNTTAPKSLTSKKSSAMANSTKAQSACLELCHKTTALGDRISALRRYRGDSEILDFLLEHGADPNKVYRGWNGVMQAVENGDEDILRLLGEKAGFDLDVKDELDRSVTEIAASRGWEEAVQILKEYAITKSA